MAILLPVATAFKVRDVASYMALGNSYERPLDATVIDRLLYAGALLGPGVIGGALSGDGNTGATKQALQDTPVSALLGLIIKYSNGPIVPPDVTPVTTARNRLILSTAYETPLDDVTFQLLNQFATLVNFPAKAGNFQDMLRDTPYSTLIYLLYWVGTTAHYRNEHPAPYPN